MNIHEKRASIDSSEFIESIEKDGRFLVKTKRYHLQVDPRLFTPDEILTAENYVDASLPVALALAHVPLLPNRSCAPVWQPVLRQYTEREPVSMKIYKQEIVPVTKIRSQQDFLSPGTLHFRCGNHVYFFVRSEHAHILQEMIDRYDSECQKLKVYYMYGRVKIKMVKDFYVDYDVSTTDRLIAATGQLLGAMVSDFSPFSRPFEEFKGPKLSEHLRQRENLVEKMKLIEEI